MADPFQKVSAANPNDDITRLVYADWLDEHDRPGRAALIRHQIANPVEQLPFGIHPGGLVAELPTIDEHPHGRFVADELRQLVSLGVTGAIFSRGFASAIATPWAAWLKTSEDLRAAFPLCELWLTTWPPYFTLTADGWEERPEPAYYWKNRGECIDAAETRFAGLEVSLPTELQPGPPAVEVAGLAGLADIGRAVGSVNAKPFAGHPARSLLLRDFSLEAGAVTCHLMPARPGEPFPSPQFTASDFDTLLAIPSTVAA